jgi:hypothetical protein
MRFLDITDPEVRRAVVERLVAERERLGVDGFAVDLAARRPVVIPRILAQMCSNKPGFCEIYARSMDELFGTLNTALGGNGTLLYNGLWNSPPGRLEDQSQLLLHADAAAVEYFGLDPRHPPRGFNEDTLPYLERIPRLPGNKPLLFFARGPWHYVDYAADYRWQRYLYASFLLGRRAEDMFKYHSSFQVPAHAGRAGGLDVYADWNIELGGAIGPYRVQGGLYQRNFSGGRVVVAPDDGGGGSVSLDASYYTPEGRLVAGDVSLAAGEALILLNTRQMVPQSPVRRHIGAGQMAGWGWAHAELIRTPEGERVRLGSLPAEREWEHDLLLDHERSLAPFERLEIQAALTGPKSALLAVAEVDDPQGEHMRAVVALGPSMRAGSGIEQAVQFRVWHREGESWPRLRLAPDAAAGRPIVLDGPRLFSASRYRFRRWSHVRFVGPLEISGVTLSQRSKVLAGSAQPPRRAAPSRSSLEVP